MQWLQLVVLAVVISLSACAYGPVFVQNVHAVVPGKVYRSAQLSPARLGELIEERGLRSIVNLRGASPGERWYDEETAAAKAAGIAHYDFGISSKREVAPDEADALIALMRQAPKPMLIHCWAGADRTGLASALYLYALDERDAAEAGRALSVRYHHLSFTSAGAMDRSFEQYVASQRVAADASQRLQALSPEPLTASPEP